MWEFGRTIILLLNIYDCSRRYHDNPIYEQFHKVPALSFQSTLAVLPCGQYIRHLCRFSGREAISSSTGSRHVNKVRHYTFPGFSLLFSLVLCNCFVWWIKLDINDGTFNMHVVLRTTCKCNIHWGFRAEWRINANWFIRYCLYMPYHQFITDYRTRLTLGIIGSDILNH